MMKVRLIGPLWTYLNDFLCKFEVERISWSFILDPRLAPCRLSLKTKRALLDAWHNLKQQPGLIGEHAAGAYSSGRTAQLPATLRFASGATLRFKKSRTSGMTSSALSSRTK